MAGLLAQAIPCDQVLHAEVDFGAGRFDLTDSLNSVPVTNTGIMLTPDGMHPAVASYVADPFDRTPRRVSDVVSTREWLASAAYREVFRQDNARYQLSLITALQAPDSGKGWVLTRSDRDFSETEVLAARALLAALALAEYLLASANRPLQDPDPPRLTQREAGILAFVARGWTAARIGRHLGISVRTVEKHVEHVYLKLGCNDRLLAVREATRLGLITWPETG